MGATKIIESVDNARDFQDFMTDFFAPLNLNPAESPMQTVTPETPANPVFGVDLIALMERDETAVPEVVVKCAEFVEKKGMTVQGLYRDGGDYKKVQQLRDAFNKGGFFYIE
jgi:hypothetical protein